MRPKNKNNHKKTGQKSVIRFGLVLLIAGTAGAVAAAGLHLHIHGAGKPMPGEGNIAQRQLGSEAARRENNMAGSPAPAETEPAQREDGCERSRRVEKLYSMLHPPDSRRRALDAVEKGQKQMDMLRDAAETSRRSADGMLNEEDK